MCSKKSDVDKLTWFNTDHGKKLKDRVSQMYENPTKELISLEIAVQFEIGFKALPALRSRECFGTITCF